MWAVSEGTSDPEIWGWLVFMASVISQANKREDDSNYFEERAEISRTGAPLTVRPSMVGLRTVMAPEGELFS